MRIVDDVAALDTHDAGGFCVLTAGADTEVAVQAAERLGLDLDRGPRTLRRPAAMVFADSVQLVVFALEDDRQLSLVRVFVTDGGFLVVAAESVLSGIREQVTEAPDDVWSAVIGVLLQLAHGSQNVLDQMIDASHHLEAQAHGFTSAPQRREMARLRNQLFEIYEIEDAQRRLLAPEEDLARSLTEHQRHVLKRAAHGFDATRSMATQLYARLGDVLTQQGTIVTERLTIVATVILPLTLVTSFFGMNFTWMVDQVGSLSAFIALGVALPVVLAALTISLTRYITRSS